MDEGKRTRSGQDGKEKKKKGKQNGNKKDGKTPHQSTFTATTQCENSSCSPHSHLFFYNNNASWVTSQRCSLSDWTRSTNLVGFLRVRAFIPLTRAWLHSCACCGCWLLLHHFVSLNSLHPPGGLPGACALTSLSGYSISCPSTLSWTSSSVRSSGPFAAERERG